MYVFFRKIKQEQGKRFRPLFRTFIRFYKALGVSCFFGLLLLKGSGKSDNSNDLVWQASLIILKRLILECI